MIDRADGDVLLEPAIDVLGGPVLHGQDGGGEEAGRVHPAHPSLSGTNCIKIGLPGKLILSKRKGLLEFLFS